MASTYYYNKDAKRQYYLDNHEKCLARSMEYYNNHKEWFAEYYKAYTVNSAYYNTMVMCPDCMVMIKRRSLWCHKRSKRHQKASNEPQLVA